MCDLRTVKPRLPVRRGTAKEWSEEGICQGLGSSSGSVDAYSPTKGLALIAGLCTAQVETQLNRTKDGQKAESTDLRTVSHESSDADSQLFPSCNSGLTTNMPLRAADVNQNIQRQRSIPEGREYSPQPVPQDPYMMPMAGNLAPDMNPDPQMMNNLDLGLDTSFSWEMIGLGLEEPMPMQEAVDELYGILQTSLSVANILSRTNIYFDKIHPSLPMLHKHRYRSSMDLAPERRPPICLRYIMWALAAAITDKYMHHQDIFYRRSRKYIEIDEMKGQGEVFVSLAHAQTWSLRCFL